MLLKAIFKPLIPCAYLIFLVFFFTSVSASENKLITDSILTKAYTATVKVYGVDTITQRQNSAQFSAVVVSPDGYLLTVAHATRPGSLYKVTFPNGKEALAKALGRIVTNPNTVQPDIAMMKLEDDGPWPYAEMGWSSTLDTGQFCFGISYPESLQLSTPFVRYGTIVHTLDEWGFLGSTCVMETGDSGGPLFDVLGRVIALHSRINQPESVSFEVPVDNYRKYWTALTQPQTYDTLPEKENDIDTDNQKELLLSRNKKLFFLLPSHSDLKSTPDCIVEIQGRLHGQNHTILGTLFEIDGFGQVIVSKSSEVDDAPRIQAEQELINLHVLGRDEANDLVALQPIGSLRQKAISFDTLSSDENVYSIGKLLYTHLSDTLTKNGVLGMANVTLSSRFSSGAFGGSLQAQNGIPTFVRVDSIGPASSAGIQVGDQVLLVNDMPVSSASNFNTEMNKYFPGNDVTFHLKRGNQTLSKTLTLIPRIHREQPHPMNRFKGGKSMRRDGFENVFIHDANIHSYECGSPVFDQNGNFLGLNIARFSHTACIALPTSVIVTFLEHIKHI